MKLSDINSFLDKHKMYLSKTKESITKNNFYTSVQGEPGGEDNKTC